MHEMSIAQSLLDIIREEMAKHDARVLKSIRLHIGQLSAIVPDSLSFCFEVMTSGTELEGAKLIMEVIPLRGAARSAIKHLRSGITPLNAPIVAVGRSIPSPDRIYPLWKWR